MVEAGYNHSVALDTTRRPRSWRHAETTPALAAMSCCRLGFSNNSSQPLEKMKPLQASRAATACDRHHDDKPGEQFLARRMPARRETNAHRPRSRRVLAMPSTALRRRAAGQRAMLPAAAAAAALYK